MESSVMSWKAFDTFRRNVSISFESRIRDTLSHYQMMNLKMIVM